MLVYFPETIVSDPPDPAVPLILNGVFILYMAGNNISVHPPQLAGGDRATGLTQMGHSSVPVFGSNVWLHNGLKMSSSRSHVLQIVVTVASLLDTCS